MAYAAVAHVAPSLPLAREDRQHLEDRIAREIRRLRRTVETVPRAEFQRAGDELDVTALRLGHEAEQAVLARCADGLAEWVAALRRLQDDPEGFGVCEECGHPIPWARLEILPTARRCAGCQSGSRVSGDS